jgi:hypothetical protein
MDAASVVEFSSRASKVGAALWPAKVLIAGVEYPATIPEPRVAMGLITGGETAEGALTVRVDVAAMPVAPSLDQAIRWKRPTESAWNSIVWWITECRRSPIDNEWKILCIVKN